MTPLASPPARAADTSAAGWQVFRDRVLAVNPFTANRVNGPLEAGVDVDGVHRAAFERLTGLAHEALAEGRGLGAVLWGEAGIGKSHLLARLARWASQDRQAYFVYLHNLQAGPENLPRSLLKGVVSVLTRGQTHNLLQTPLCELACAGVKQAISPDTSRPWPEVELAFDQLVEGLSEADPARAALVDRQVYRVLYRFFHSAYRMSRGEDEPLATLAVRWLSGDFLDPDEAHQLGLPPARPRDEPVALADNQQIKQVLVALAQLARYRRQPLLLCLDQVDNLDEDQVTALARFLEALLDSAPNLLVVTAGVKATLVDYRARGVIQSSAWDRLAQFEIDLQRIGEKEALDILAARLRPFRESLGELAPVRQPLQLDPLFPLGKSWADSFFKGRIDCRPRDLLSAAREAWRREQETLREVGGSDWLAGRDSGRTSAANGAASRMSPAQLLEAIDARVEQKMAEHRARREAEPGGLPSDAGNLAGVVQALLEQCLHAGRLHGIAHLEKLPRPKNSPPPALDLLVRIRPAAGRETLAGLLFLVTDSTISTTHYLRRLVEYDQPLDRLLLITDQRQPLLLGNKGDEYLTALRGRRRFQRIELTFAEYVQLDALRAVVGLARAGDLEIEDPPGQARQVSAPEVIASHQRRGRYLAAPVLRELLAEEVPGPQPAAAGPVASSPA